jgi:hypothetical protein
MTTPAILADHGQSATSGTQTWNRGCTYRAAEEHNAIC